MRLRKAPYTEFRRVSSSLDDFTSIDVSPQFMINNIAMMDMELKENDLISFMNPLCPQCHSKKVVRNGTCTRVMENGTVFRVQRYICRDCRYSFVARPPNYGYGKHHPDDIKEKSVRTRIKTSLRKAAALFRIIGNAIISHETLRRCVPSLPGETMESSGYFVYDEQYAHIDGIEKYRALLKDSKNGNFVEEMLDDLEEDTLIGFFIRALSRFSIHSTIYITTDGYHYESSFRDVSTRMGIRIRRQRCLFHLEKDIVHKIEEKHMDDELDLAKKLIKFMFFQTDENLKKMGRYSEVVSRDIESKSEVEVVEYMIHLLNTYYGDDPIISKFLSFIDENRKEVFLYLDNSLVEKTTGIAEHHFSIMSWLLKHRFKTKQGLLKTSYWYHHYLSTGI